MSTYPKLNAAALGPLYEALKECLMAVPIHWTETRASASAALILAESEPTDMEEQPPSDEENRSLDRLLELAESAPEEQPPSGLMQMHGEVDEYGECPNCANPPHEGECKRKQPPSGAMTTERARGIAVEIVSRSAPISLRVAIQEALCKTDRAARRGTLEWVQDLHVHCGGLSFDNEVERRLEGLK